MSLLRYIFLPVFLLAVAVAIPAQAQEETINPEDSLLVTETLPDEAVSCFDYYAFESIDVKLQPSTPRVASGTEMAFQGTIDNQNSYPIVNGGLYVKIFREQPSNRFEIANGFELVDQFYVAEGLDLPANGSKDVEFMWDVPAHLPSGDYRMATYFNTANRFNLSGLTFTDDIAGGLVSFTVSGDTDTTVLFDKNSVTLNDRDHYFTNALDTFPQNDPVTVQATLVNQTNQEQTVPVKWTLYYWDGLRQEAILDTQQASVSVAANQSQAVSYTVENADYPVYFLVAQAQYNDTQSLLDIRFVREGIEQTRINFPAVTDFPLQKGQETTLFSCVHSTTNGVTVDNNRLELELKDVNGKTIHSYSYEGSITSQMMGLKDEFTPKKDYDQFTLVATLYTDDTLIDTVTLNYNCQDIDPSSCTKESGGLGDTLKKDSSATVLSIIIVVGIAALVILLYAIVKNKKGMVKLLLVAAFAAGGLLLGGQSAQAEESVTWSYHQETNYDGTSGGIDGTGSYNKSLFGYMCRENRGGAMDWQEIVRESFYDVTYRARVVDADGNEILNGATIPAGSQITIEKSPHESSDLYWHGMGGNLDTPYGHWLVGAAAPPMEFSPQDLFIDDHGRTGYDIYIPFSVNPPATSIQVSGTAGYSCNADNSACTVESEGTFLPEVVFDQTIGKSYLRVDYEQETGLRYCSNANNTDNALIIGETRLSSSPTEFMINVPQQSISFNFSVIEQSTPPTDPIIDPYEETNTGVPNESQAFSVVSTDPDGDSLYYQIDWDGDEIGDQRVPGFDYVASGISQDIAKTWIAEGTYTFKARAIDETGAQSGWTDHIVTITDPATPQLVVCPDNPTLSAIGSTQQMIAYYHAGTTETLDCTSQPAGTQDVTTSSTWSSDNSGVASVSPSGGLVTANSASGDGKADIEALYSGLNDATTATVLGLVNCYTCDTTSGSCSGSLQASCDASAGEYSDQSSCEADCSTSGGSSGGTNWREVAP